MLSFPPIPLAVGILFVLVGAALGVRARLGVAAPDWLRTASWTLFLGGIVLMVLTVLASLA